MGGGRMENAVKTIHFWKSRSTLLEVTFHTFGKNLGGSCEVRSKLGALGAFGGKRVDMWV